MKRILLPMLIAISIAACGDSTTDDAQRTKDVLTGDASIKAGDHPACKLFTPDELSTYIGDALSVGQNAGMGMGCQWVTEDESGDVMIIIVPKDYHEAPRLAPGYTELPTIGEQGFVAPELGGWVAASIVGDESIRVTVAGGAASAISAQALLEETINRHSESGK